MPKAFPPEFRRDVVADRRLGSAQDLVQATLEKCWMRWDRIGAAPSPDGYARQVMMSVFFRWRRRRWVGEYPHAQVPELPVDDAMAARMPCR
jgi:DNA-directed RNA polymerase specialized sigma24 family protein